MLNVIPSTTELLEKALELFREHYQAEPEIATCGPGRVNLIGEHTDYNDGFVLPMALPLVTIVAGKQNGTRDVNIYTAANDVDEPKKIKFSLNDRIEPGRPKWANYLKGVIAHFKGSSVPGFDAVIVSSIPVGGGLSSSAAIEVATYIFLEVLTGHLMFSPVEKALTCQTVEHKYAGVPCGIMDQLVCVLGRDNHALLIDCKSLDVNYVSFQNIDVIILITNSNVKHELSSGEYAIRKKQCEEAVSILGIKSLRDATNSDLLCLESKGADKAVVARARHVITEIKRTEEAANALKENDFVKFGKLMVESHNSLRDDYEVSCRELDEIVEASLAVEGVFGSRLTGGGFGGCTVTLLKKEAVERCISHIKTKYSGDPIFYVCQPSSGAKQLLITK
ncbi:hypothetical protein RUM43_004936 [Polyplax serrata]|uniref:Galactokinase n=1 Tax=Polyplax serrata TaxID=468196 RepID=A0AAN8SCA4_POLSC